MSASTESKVDIVRLAEGAEEEAVEDVEEEPTETVEPKEWTPS